MSGSQDFDKTLSEVLSNLLDGGREYEYEFWKSPDLLEEVREGRLPLGQLLGAHEIADLRALLSGLIGLFIQRRAGDERARWQLDVVHKFIFPQKFEVPWTVVESLSKRYESGHLIRAWALRRLMHELADLVELDRTDLEDIPASLVFIATGANKEHRLFPLVEKYCRRKTTLQSLAIRVYLELIQNQNAEGTIDERTLRRDLKRLQAWEDRDPVHTHLKKEYAEARAGHHWKSLIPIRLYSESFRPATSDEIQESDHLASLQEAGHEE